MRRWPLSRALRCGLELAEALRYLRLLATTYNYLLSTTYYHHLLPTSKIKCHLATHYLLPTTAHYFSYCLLLTTRRCATAMTTPCLASA